MCAPRRSNFTRRCAPSQPPLSVLQLANRRKCVRFSTDLVAASALPHHTGGFTLQLWDLAHTWSDRDDNDIDMSDILAWEAAVYMFIKLGPSWPQQPRFPTAPRHPDLLAAPPAVLADCAHLTAATHVQIFPFGADCVASEVGAPASYTPTVLWICLSAFACVPPAAHCSFLRV